MLAPSSLALRRCEACGTPIASTSRSDRRFCGGACAARKRRRRKRPPPRLVEVERDDDDPLVTDKQIERACVASLLRAVRGSAAGLTASTTRA
jgi:hypothetical protein